MEEAKEGRLRDPLEEESFMRDPLPGSRGDWQHRMSAVRRCNHTLSALGRLARGGTSGVALKPFRYRGGSLVRPSTLRGRFAEGILRHTSTFTPPAGRATGREALFRLVGDSALLGRRLNNVYTLASGTPAGLALAKPEVAKDFFKKDETIGLGDSGKVPPLKKEEISALQW